MIGTSATIQSRMTPDEVIEFAKRVLELAGVASTSLVRDDPQMVAQALQSRTHLLATVISVCGRPIAAAEVAAIQQAQSEFERANKAWRTLGSPRPVPFGNTRSERANPLPDGNQGPDSGQVPATPASGEWEP